MGPVMLLIPYSLVFFYCEPLLVSLSTEQLARCFITYLLSATIFDDKSNGTWFHYLSSIADFSHICEYDWGVAGYAKFLRQVRRACRVSDTSTSEHFTLTNMGGYWNILKVCLFPWLDDGRSRASVSSDVFSMALHLTRSRKLLKGPFDYVWYMGERVSVQYFTSCLVPMDPPSSMFQLNSPLNPTVICDLSVEGVPSDSLVIEDDDYGTLHQTRLAPPVVRREIRTRVTLPKTHARVVDLHGRKTFEDIQLLPDPVNGLPFPSVFKRFDPAKSVQMWRLLKSSMKRVEDLSNFHGVWPSIPKTATLNLGHVGLNGSGAGSVAGLAPMSVRLYDIARMFSLSVT